MKLKPTRFHLFCLAVCLTLFASTRILAQCVNQGSVSDPGCGSSVTVFNVGGGQNWSLSNTSGADYSVSISGGGSGCGLYALTTTSFTGSGAAVSEDVFAGGSCCWAAGGTSAVLTYTKINYTNTTSSANLCQNSSRALTVSPSPLTPGTWSVINGTGTGTISGTTFTPASPGTVTIRYTKGGCNSDVGITIDPAPTTATVGVNQSVCGLSSNALGGNTPSSGTGTWSQISGPGSTTFSSVNSGSSSASVTAYGTYTYQWSIATGGSCPASTATLTVTYSNSPTAATVGGAQSVCGLTSGGLGGNTPAVGTGTWTQTGGPGTSTFSSVNSGSSTATASVPGTYQYTWTITNGACASTSASVSVTYYASPTTAAVGGTQNICGSLTSGNLGGNSPAVGSGTWTQTGGPGTTTFSNANSGSASATATVPGNYTYTWTITNGTCPPSSASVSVNFYANPSTATVGAQQDLCGVLTSNPLGGNTPVTGTGTWTQTAGPGTTTFSNANSGSSTATATVSGSYQYTWTIANGTCPTSAATVNVNFFAGPTVATAGPMQNVCGSLTSGSLGGNTPVVGVGTWTQASGPGTTFFSNANSGSSTAAVSSVGTYIFTWTITNGTCSTTANDTVNYYATPTIATVGATQSLCGTLTSGSLGGNTPAVGTGVWTQTAGPGTTTFSNANSGSSTATASVTGSYTYTWTITNGTCPPSTASIVVNYIATPSGGSIANTAYCSAVGFGSVSVVGVSNANVYTWALPAGLSGSSTTSTISVGGASPGSYTVTVTPQDTAFGTTCSGSPITGVVTILAQPVITNVNLGSLSCFGGSNDTITVTGTTTNGNLFYSITGGAPYSNSTGLFPNLTAGTYNISVQDDSLCTTNYALNPVTVISPPDILLSIASFGDVPCNGDSTGFVNVSASGGTGALTFLWNNGSTFQNISHLAAGTYTLTATDGNGCTKSISQVINQPTALTDSISYTNISCYGANNATATFVVSGGVPPYTYLWSTGDTVPTLTNLNSALYSVTATDKNGCIVVNSVNIVNPLPVTISLSVTNVDCFGANDGKITSTVTGGTGTYTYVWSPNVSVTGTVSNAGPGTYSVTVSDANGCSATANATVTQPLTGLSLASIVTPVKCANDSNGAIELLPSGGVGGYTYLWSGGQTLQIISGLPAGTYTASVTDGNGCQAIISDNITNPTPITSSVVGTSSLCAGSGGGSATLTVSGGVPGYTFLWSDLETTQNISNLTGGLYRVIITDTNGCKHNDSVTITQPSAIVATFATTNVNCFGASNGTITVTVTGGTGSYTYAWTPNVSSGPTVTGVGPGTYVVTITDGNGCTLVDSATVTQPAAAVSATAVVSDMTCNNSNNGSISLLVSGGTGSYTYLWTGGATTPSISGLSAGTYFVTVTDANGCTAGASGTITNPAPMTSTTSGTDVTCAGAANGTASVTSVTGGTTPYTYLWSNFAATSTIGNLSGGLYRVIITDSNGCQQRDSVFVNEPQPLVITLSANNVNCAGAGNGTITANVTGGTGAYTYAWTPNVSSGPTVTNALPGTYVVTVTDGNGCTSSDSTVLTQPQGLTTLVTVTDVVCYGAANGSATVTTSGGSGVYTYTWNPNVSSGPTASNLAPGTYYVTVTDANGCFKVDSGKITQPASPIVVTSVVHNITCYGQNNGSILVLGSGGTGSFTYLWSNGSTSQYITGLSMSSPLASTTLFRVTVTDANGCSVVVTDTLRSPSAISSSIIGTNVTCAGAHNGSAVLTVSGGIRPYTYLWSNLATTQNLTNVAGGFYTVLITDSNGCQKTDTVTITEPQPIQITLSTTNIDCFGANDGKVISNVTGGTGAYTYAWTPNVSSGPTVSNAGPGTYVLTVTDANNCTATDSATITQPATAVTVSLMVSNITCNGANNGSINAQATGGSGVYTYAWTGSAAQTSFINGLSANTYTVTVTDASGCTATASATLTDPAAITSSIVATNVTCAGASNGSATLTVNGGTLPYTFQWSNLSGNQNLTNVPGGFYTVLITDSNGCRHTDTITIQEPLPLQISVTGSNVTCFGASNGSVTASVSGGSGGYTYNWNPNVSSGPTASNVGPGTYVVTVTDGGGCSGVDSITITQPVSGLLVQSNVVNISCSGNSNGSISLSVSGGTPSYTFLWNTGPQTQVITNLPAGIYTATVTDAAGCSVVVNDTVKIPTAITSSVVGTNVTCAGANNGSAQLTVNGGQVPYTFLWSNFEGTQNVDSLSGGLYHVIITDANGCQHRDSVFITEPLPLVATLAVTPISCNNTNDGSITVTTTGGTGAPSYQWSAPGSQITPTISNLSANTYTVTVKDVNNCSATATATLVNPSSLSVANVVINPKCNGSANGTITLIVNGGTPQYGYTWSPNVSSGQSASNVAPGSYYVTVTDSHGCTATDSANVVAPSPIYVSAIITNVSCNGSHDGFIIATGYGGVLPYSYQWHFDSINGAPGPITKDWTQLSGGDYYLVITDANNCSASYHAGVKEADSLKISLSKADVTCFGLSTGSVSVNVMGGTTPYHYLWNDFVTDSSQTAVPAGSYGVVVTDSNGCQQTKTIVVAQPQPISAAVNLVNPACAGSATGSVEVIPTGGTTPYSYAWSTVPVQNGSQASNLPAGKYYVTVTDGNTCSFIDSGTLVGPQTLHVNTAITNPTCSDGNNGFVSLDVRGGSAPYTYNWNTAPAQTGNVASGLVSGTYIATITDVAGCQLLDTATVVAPQPIVITVGSLGNSNCINSADGYAVVAVSGGLAPYIYQLGQVSQYSDTFTNLVPGTYSLTVRDANGCQAVTTWTIHSASSFTVHLTATPDVILAGETVQLTATPTSDTTVTGYIWSTLDSLNFTGCPDPANCPTPTATPTRDHIYVVQAVNARGCIATDTVHVKVSDHPSAFMPSAFTPNGDGLNDKFEFDILGAKTVDVQIWNRWGEKVFSNPAQLNGINVVGNTAWDGTFRGQKAEYDNYTYQMVITYFDGHQETIAGTVVLMR